MIRYLRTFLVIPLTLSLFSVRAQKSSNALATNELEIMNFSSESVVFRSSFNKSIWTRHTLAVNKQLSFTLPRLSEFCFVELCQRNTDGVSSCDTFRLKPARRYSITLSDEGDKYVVRYARDPQ
ncbi:MAG: hypothetical protein JST68_27245 [Bacteroidetes bacterium]|nr:hypothetical protein [Bacteroidota bacterium]